MTNYARSDVYPPEVEAIGDMHGCTTEGHAFGCPCGMGGDPILDRCWLCRRIEDGGGVLVTVEGRVRWMCSYCEDQSADEIRIPLDMTEGTDDD